MEEELLLLKHYQATCQHICQELRFPRKVLGTAVLYLKRFYLTHSTLDYDPQHIVVTCLYLACKVSSSSRLCPCWDFYLALRARGCRWMRPGVLVGAAQGRAGGTLVCPCRRRLS